jgi:hypothetical protein
MPPQSIAQRIFCAPTLAGAFSVLNAYANAGGQIMFGTDVGYTDAYDATGEYRLLARALDCLDGDPAKDVTAFARVRLAIRAGHTIYGH